MKELNILASQIFFVVSQTQTFSVWIPHKPFDTSVYSLEIFQERPLVIFPELLQLLCWRKLAATYFNSDLKSVGVEVVIVLHASSQWIPVSAVGDT